jgi:soluble lytic murein transglycosylase-like protein
VELSHPELWSEAKDLKALVKFVLAVVVFALPAWAGELAILNNGFSIRSERHVPVGAITRLYLSSDGKSYTDLPTADIHHFEEDLSQPTPVEPAPSLLPPPKPTLNEVVTATGIQHRIDPDLIRSMIHAESNFNTKAHSSKGAQGLMQLMPQTAKNLGVSNVYDAQENIDGGTRYLKQLLELYNYDLVKTLAAYNAGPGRVSKYRGVPPYRETQMYIRKIILDYNRKKLADQKTAAATKKNVLKQTARETSAAQGLR